MAVDVGELENLAALLDVAASNHESAVAVSSSREPEADLSYGRLRELVGRAAAGLQARGAERGARILVAVKPGPLWPVAFFACLRAGCTAVPLPADLAPAAWASMAAHTEAHLLIGPPTNDEARKITARLTCCTVEELLETSHSPGPMVAASPDETAVLIHTSGSTDRPRAVELTHRNLLSNLHGLLCIRRGGPGDTALSVLPPSHAFELVVGQLAPLASGARIVYAGPLLPHRLLETMRRQAISHAVVVPSLARSWYAEILDQLVDVERVSEERRLQDPQLVLERVRSGLNRDELDQLRQEVRARIGPAFRSLIVGGAALDPALAELMRILGIQVDVGYGLSEAGPIVSVGGVGECPPGSVGRPLPGVDVRLSEDGEILVRGASVMRGYWRDPEATKRVIEAGWLHTGDVGTLDSDGHLFVVGRLKEAMVTAAGRTIYPDEAELYYRSSLFAELCVAALPGEHGNDRPTLFVVPSAADVSDAALQAEFSRLRRDAPASCRLERLVRVATPLPRSAAGKVLRRILVERHMHPSREH